MKPLARRLARAVRALWRLQPLTALGWAVGVGGWLIYDHYGRDESDFVLRAAMLLTLTILIVAVAFVLLATLYLLLRLRGHGAQVTERAVDGGTPIRTGLTLPGLRFWPLVDVDLSWERPAAVDVTLQREGGDLVEEVTPRTRGRYSSIRRLFTVRDIFGLAAIRFPRTQAAALRFAPAQGAADVALALRHASGEGYAHPAGEPEGDLVEMRRYAPGDPLRMVLWKAYARTRRMLVRMPERAIAPRPSTVAYFVAGPGDEPTASVARLFLEQGLLGDEFLFAADGADHPVTLPDEALDAVIDSVRARDRGGEGVGHFLRGVDHAQLGNCVFFVPGERGPWLDRLLEATRALPAPPTIVVGIDGALTPSRQGRAARVLQAVPPADRSIEALPAVHRALAHTGAVVRVVHRSSGRLLTDDELSRVGPTEAAA